MTKEEYKNKMKEIEEDAYKKKKELMKEYALSNNPYKIGEIIEDHIGKLKIEKIKVAFSFLQDPCCVYYGIELKKNGKPKKRQESRVVFQSNILRI